MHKWSTVYQFVGVPSMGIDTAAAELLRAADDEMCWGPAAYDGGTYECQIYDHATGGVPVATSTTFDPTVTGDWTGYDGSSWATAAGNFHTDAEAALSVEWNAGLSSSGKPVKLRKWYHAVPDQSVVGNAQNVLAADVTKLTTAANALITVLSSYGLSMGSSTGRFAGSATVLPFLGSHQMPRGRRRRALVTAGGRYTGPTIEVPSLEAD
uniref:Uncharacterized protein n=1 Tax=uncultured prokaryote TaxID=198431 RepID=A0A0H5Q5L1_9ZZZZ|nr:hypothetical protein [uncultured prokaryote]